MSQLLNALFILTELFALRGHSTAPALVFSGSQQPLPTGAAVVSCDATGYAAVTPIVALTR